MGSCSSGNRLVYPYRGVGFVTGAHSLHLDLAVRRHRFFETGELIKAAFCKRVRDLFRREEWANASKAKHRESMVWQHRFWEHHIRDQADFNRPMDYLPWNPGKAGRVGTAHQ
jgi:hypothetical protein